MTQPQETATPAPEEPQGSAPAAGDTQAGATAEHTQAGGQPQEAAPAQTEDEVPEGLSADTWAAMPKAEKKKLNQYFTQRTQQLSAREKELEQTIAALNTAVQSTQQPAAPPPPPADALALQAIEAQFGSEAARAFDQLTQARVAETRAELDRLRGEHQGQKLISEWDAFVRDNPDAKTLETAMTQIATQLRPNGMPIRDFYDTLYTIALKRSGRLESHITKQVTERITASARNVEQPPSGVTPSKVTPNPPDLSKLSWSESIKAAAEAAKKGERWNQ